MRKNNNIEPNPPIMGRANAMFACFFLINKKNFLHQITVGALAGEATRFSREGSDR
jgi:hypothetical protein